MNQQTFSALPLGSERIEAVKAAGYIEPTEIQSLAIPQLVAGRDLLATAQTGTGKTAAFVLPMFERITPDGDRRGPVRPHALIVTPTRELALQIAESIDRYGAGSRLRCVTLFGGASRNRQLGELRGRPHVVVATPGRLLDFQGEGEIDLSAVRYLVLDEADRMLDMGFINPMRKIVALTPADRQTALFSATMPPQIEALASEFLRNPARVSAQTGEVRVEQIDHSVMYVGQEDKLALLGEIIRERGMFRVLVFTRTKHRASRVAKALAKQSYRSDAIHGNKSQSARNRALTEFKSGKLDVLVATDVASRGIDVEDVTHVINFEIPNEPETYVHRVGRTARAGSDGAAISFVDESEMGYIRDIEKLLGGRISVDADHAYHKERATVVQSASGSRGRSNGGSQGNRSGGSPANGSGNLNARGDSGGGGNAGGGRNGNGNSRGSRNAGSSGTPRGSRTGNGRTDGHARGNGSSGGDGNTRGDGNGRDRGNDGAPRKTAGSGSRSRSRRRRSRGGARRRAE